MATPFDTLDFAHHACVIVGDSAEHDALILALAKKHKIKLAGNPDFSDRTYETFSIDDARELKSAAATRPAQVGGRKVFVMTMNGITVEAQNALLKLFEEPGEYARFFMIIPSAHLLIPTVKSRVQMLGTQGKEARSKEQGVRSKEQGDVVAAAKTFLAAPVKKRLDIIKELMDQIGKEKKSKQDAIDLLHALEEQIYAQASAGNAAARAAGLAKKGQALESILLAGKYATDRAPSMKMLLEYVALNV